MSWLSRRRTAVVALKAAVATGLAFYLGRQLPSPIDDYNYYAALGAFTVVGLVVVDSVKESLRVLGAVAIGVSLAVLVQYVTATNALSVALTVLACTLLSSLPVLGAQRTWAPLAALFVLATGGSHPEPMALGYVVQVPLGAAVGVLVNLVLLAPLGLGELERSTARVLKLLPERMRGYADALEEWVDDPGEGGQLGADEVVPDQAERMRVARVELSAAINESRRARRANPWRRVPGQHDVLVAARAEATSRCAAAVEAMAVVLGGSGRADSDYGADLRRRTAEVLRRAADVFEDPRRDPDGDARVARAQESVDRLLGRIGTVGPQEGADPFLFGALGATIRHVLRYARYIAEPNAAS